MEIGDKVVIRYSPCRICDSDVVWIGEMDEFDGKEFTVSWVGGNLRCGGMMFEVEEEGGYTYSTCWVEEKLNLDNPDWRV